MPGPSDFLAKRHREFLTEIVGEETVSYIKFNSASRNALTRDFDETLAYNTTPILIPAKIDYFPTKAFRALQGQSIKFESIIRISTRELTAKLITINIGDAFILPDKSEKRYVSKTQEMKQRSGEFLEVMIYVSTEVGHRA